MYNDFVVVGPKSDPAGARAGHRRRAEEGQGDGRAVRLARRQERHACRRARAVEGAGIDLRRQGRVVPRDRLGMGPALNTASAMNAYAFTDRGTWLSFKNRGELGIVVEGDRRLFNQYGVMLVNPANHPHVKKALASRSSTGWCRRRAKAIADTRSRASSCSFRTPPRRAHDVAASGARLLCMGLFFRTWHRAPRIGVGQRSQSGRAGSVPKPSLTL